MGQRFDAICEQCGHHFAVDLGGGFVFHMLHCDTCGRDKDVQFEELGDAHLRYLKGLSGPYSVATREFDQHVQETYPEPPISEAEYNEIVEKTAGRCKCGGQFKLDAPPRCPKCRSTKYKQDPEGPMVLRD